MIEKQELYCHECGNYVQFTIDTELNGNHVLNCPKCGHEHCRVVKDGKITGDRWDSKNGTINTYCVTGSTWSASSTWTTYNSTTSDSTGRYFLYAAWANAGN